MYRLEVGGLYGAFLKYMAFAAFLMVFSGGLPAVAAGESPDKSDAVAAKVICNVIVFVQKLGLPIMTGVILGSSIMAIFGKLAWPAIVMLVVFTAIFFGCGKLMQKFAAGLNDEFSKASSFECKGGGATTLE